MAVKKRRDELTQRTKRVLRALVRRGKKDKVGAMISAVASEMLPALEAIHKGEEYADQVKSLERYLEGESLPSSDKAWALGEALRKTAPWSTGLWMLWVCGYYAEVIGTIAIWLRRRRETLQSTFKSRLAEAASAESAAALLEQDDAAISVDVDMLWNMIAKASALAQTPFGDHADGFRSMYVYGTSLDPHGITLLRQVDDIGLRTALEARELAKGAWMQSLQHGTDIHEAYIVFRDNGFETTSEKEREEIEKEQKEIGYALGHDDVIDAAIQIARSPKLTVAATELSLLILIGLWFNGVGNDLFAPIRLPREVDWTGLSIFA